MDYLNKQPALQEPVSLHALDSLVYEIPNFVTIEKNGDMWDETKVRVTFNLTDVNSQMSIGHFPQRCSSCFANDGNVYIYCRDNPKCSLHTKEQWTELHIMLASYAG